MKADVGDGDVGARLAAQSSILPVAVPDTCRTQPKVNTEQNKQSQISLKRLCLCWIPTVADGGDDAEDEQPEEHVGGVAQQQDEEQADHHGDHQAAASQKDRTQWDWKPACIGS